MAESYPRIAQVVLDTTDARTLAGFYRQLFGLEYRAGDEPPAPSRPDPRGSDWLVLRNPHGGPQLAFQQTDGVRPSTWPDAGDRFQPCERRAPNGSWARSAFWIARSIACSISWFMARPYCPHARGRSAIPPPCSSFVPNNVALLGPIRMTVGLATRLPGRPHRLYY